MTGPFRPAPNGQQGYPGQQQQQQPVLPQQYQQPAPQQPPQPQVPFTQNVMPEPAYQMPAPYFPPQQQQAPQVPQYAPAWQGGQPIQPQPQQPQPQYAPPGYPQQQPQRQQAPAQAINVDANGRLFGPGLPQELQGKTMQEAVGIYGAMRQYTVQQQAQQRPQPQQQAQQPQPQGPQVPAQRPSTNFFTDPEGAIERAVQRIVTPMLQPVLESTAETQIAQARQTVAQLHPEFAQYEGEVIQRLQGLPAQTLANPAAWRMALQQVVGERFMSGQLQQQPHQQQRQQQAQLPAGYPGAQPQQQQQVNMPWQPAAAPPFFTESPSAVMMQGAQGGPVGGVQLTPQQQEAARRFGMTNEQYIQGMGAGYHVG